MKWLIWLILAVVAIAVMVYALADDNTTPVSNNADTMTQKDITESTDHTGDAMMADEDAMMKKEDEMEKESMMEDDAMMKKDDTMMKDEDSMEIKDDAMEKEAMIEKPGSFVKLEDTDISTLSGNIVLDFSATWCPSCQALKKDVEVSLNDIPSDTTIVLVDYDSNQDLKVKYGVTGQHTFVQVTPSGEKIKLWRGGNTLEDVLANIQ